MLLSIFQSAQLAKLALAEMVDSLLLAVTILCGILNAVYLNSDVLYHCIQGLTENPMAHQNTPTAWQQCYSMLMFQVSCNPLVPIAYLRLRVWLCTCCGC